MKECDEDGHVWVDTLWLSWCCRCHKDYGDLLYEKYAKGKEEDI